MQSHQWIAGVLALAGMLLSGHSAQAQVITLSDNLNQTAHAIDYSTTTAWQAQHFFTQSQSYSLLSVTLQMAYSPTFSSNPHQDDVRLELYTGSSSSPTPSSSGLSLNRVGTITSSISQVQFSASGITLTPNTDYWIVLKSGDSRTVFEWSNTQSLAGTGVGRSVNYAKTNDSGSTWNAFSTNPYRMRVEVQAVPEPSSFVLAGLGLGAMGLIRRHRKKKQADAETPSV